jgi:hypothetical protein
LHNDKGKLSRFGGIPDQELGTSLAELPLSGPLQHGSSYALEFSGHGNETKENNLLLSDGSSHDEYKSNE